MTKVRTHVVLPEELLAELDALVGKRGRSEFIADAVALALRQERQRRAIIAVIAEAEKPDVPGWDDPDAWVREARRDRPSAQWWADEPPK